MDYHKTVVLPDAETPDQEEAWNEARIEAIEAMSEVIAEYMERLAAIQPTGEDMAFWHNWSNLSKADARTFAAEVASDAIYSGVDQAFARAHRALRERVNT